MIELRRYRAPEGKEVFTEWLRRLRNVQAKAAIINRLGRMEHGNFGDRKFVKDGVWEARINMGPGYRLYYGIAGKELVVLLCGGDKPTQNADISRACDYWKEWQERREHERQK
jgi:putative addiction module killer protein